MPLKEIAAIFLFLTLVIAFGHLWYSVVESVLGKIKKLFVSPKETVWHPFPTDKKDD